MVTLKQLQDKHNAKMINKVKPNKERIGIAPRKYESIDVDSSNHYGIKNKSKRVGYMAAQS